MSAEPLANAKYEAFARELAKFTNVYQAYKVAGYKEGTSFKPNARKLAQNADVKARVAYLQRVSGVTVAIDSAYLQRKLVEIADTVIDPDDIKISDQLKALEMLGKLNGLFAPEKHDVTLTNLAQRLDAAMRRTDTDNGKA
jgi:hypothetical protein